MVLKNTVIFRGPDELKSQLESVSKKLGLSKSAIARNTLALAILPPKSAKKNRLSDYVNRLCLPQENAERVN